MKVIVAWMHNYHYLCCNLQFTKKSFTKAECVGAVLQIANILNMIFLFLHKRSTDEVITQLNLTEEWTCVFLGDYYLKVMKNKP